MRRCDGREEVPAHPLVQLRRIDGLSFRGKASFVQADDRPWVTRRQTPRATMVAPGAPLWRRRAPIVKRRLVVAAVVLVLAGAGGLLWLRANLDSVVQRAIVHYGGQMTQASVVVDKVRIRGADGVGAIEGLQLGNPRGFTAPYAFKVNEVEVTLDVRTLLDDVVVIRRILIDSPDVIYEQAGNTTNFDALQRNIAKALNSGEAATAPSGKPARKLIVEELVIRQANAQAAAPFLVNQRVNVRLPDIVLKNVGRKEGGVTPARLGQIVATALSQRLAAQISFDRLARALGDGGKSLGDTVRGWFGR